MNRKYENYDELIWAASARMITAVAKTKPRTKTVARFIGAVPYLRRHACSWFLESFDRRPRLRAWLAKLLGVRGNLPFLFEGRFLRIDYASTDELRNVVTGGLSAWLYHFAYTLEETIWRYPALADVSRALDDHGYFAFPIHFHPIGPGAHVMNLTETFIDGSVETPFFSMLDDFAREHMKNAPAPAGFYLVFELDPSKFGAKRISQMTDNYGAPM